MAVEKYRWFAFLVYPESAPDGWWDWCRSTHGEFCRSPLHSPDDVVTKSHYHVMYRHPNTVRLGYATNFLSPVAANAYVEPIVHPSNYMRYLLHLDDGEKEQFEGNPYELCECLGGFPLDFTREYGPAERREQRRGLLEFVRRTGIVEYGYLVYRLQGEGLYDLFDYACQNTYFVTHLLLSLRHGIIPVEETNADNVSYVKLVPALEAIRKDVQEDG